MPYVEELPGDAAAETSSPGDRDDDGVADDRDQCPDAPEDLDGHDDGDGCYDADNDGDDRADQSDLCPGEAEDVDRFDDGDGCPDPDNDQDRIADSQDACPNEAEVYNGTADGDGCPDQGGVDVRVAGSTMTVLDKIYFADGASTLASHQLPALDAIASTLQGNPQIRLVEVGGHADGRGRDRGSADLARRRAEAVVAYLTSHGVEPARLRPAAYGAGCPIYPAFRAGSRANNRRVEFTVLETDAGPVTVDRACQPIQVP
jgi:outer membrane protein OmpA-like peptidoglycan-associated protein